MPKSKKKKKRPSPSDKYSVKYTPNGNKITLHPGAIYIDGNNNTVVNNAKDVNIEMKYDGNQNICKTNSGDDASSERDKQPSKTQKFIKKQLLLLCLNYDENCNDFNCEEEKQMLQQIQDIEKMMRKEGLILRSVSSGSLVFNVLVEDLHALENLKESHDSGAFILELAKIFASNDVEQFCKCWSTHIDEQMYSKALSELKEIEAKDSTIAEWNRGQVRQWLLSEVEFNKEIANKLYQEEVVGKNLLYTNEEILQDFNLEVTDLRMLQYSIEDEREKMLETSQLHNLVTTDCSPDEVCDFLLQIGIKPIHAEKFKYMNMSGKKFLRYKVEHLRHDFGLPSGPLQLVHHFQKLSRSEQKNPTVADVGEHISSKIPVNANLKEKSLSTVEEVIPGHGHRMSTKHRSLMKNRPIQESCKLEEALEGKSEFGFDEEPQSKFLSTEKHQEGRKEHHSVVSKNIISKTEATNLVRELLLGTLQLKERFDLMYSTILVVNEPDANIAQTDKKEWFRFIPKVQWKVVFDFDAASNENGICQIMSEKQKVNIYYPEDIANVISPSDINYSEIPAWIFCNGCTDSDVKALNKMSWIENKSQDMDNVVQFFSNSSIIRKGNALVIFLILSNNIEVMVEAFRKFFTDFGLQNIIFICENPDIFEKWCNLAAKICDPQRLPERSIVGVPWSTLCSIIMQMQGVNVKSDFMLPTVDGKPCFLLERDISRMIDLSIVSYNECENTDMDENHPDFQDFRNNRELEFYRGEKLDSWNFMLTEMGYDQVCPREIKENLKKMVLNRVTDAESVIHWINLYHQPGSGGSTVARQVLWEFRKTFRCVILKRITNQTSSQIMDVWNYGEKHGNDNKSYLPLIILSDNLGEDELHDMVFDLKHKTKNVTGHICIILSCKRKSSLEEVKRSKNSNSCILEHSLSDNEKQWFNRKYSQLEEKQKTDISFQPDHLLAFMVMKEEFRKEKIERIVERVLTDIKEQGSNEFELVQYAALLSKYERDSMIPVPCCDEHMGYAFSSKQKTKISPWEKRRSEASLLLMATADIHDLGSVQGLKIVHPIVAEFIVKVCVQSEPLANLVKRYLQSKLHTAISSSRKYLNRQTHNLLIKRTRSNEANTQKQLYSSVILDIADVNKEAAYNILITGFDVLGDPIVAQQTARYCSHVMEDYKEALKFIEKAIEMQQFNSFLWDTKGQIYKQEIQRSYYIKYCVKQNVLSITSSLELLDLAFKGIECFQMSQKMTLVDKTDNTSGFSNEVDLSFKLLDVLTRLDIFRNSNERRQMLQQYLVDQSYRPVELGMWAQYLQKMKTLMGNVDTAMEAMSTFLTVQKGWSDFTPVAQLTSFTPDELGKKFGYYIDMWKTHFGSIDANEIHWKTPENINELRRISARKLGAPQLRKMFDLANDDDIQSLVDIRNLLNQNKPYTAFDLKGILLAYLALSSAPNNKKCQFDLPSMKTIIDIAKEYDQRERKENSNMLSLYPPFFLLMMLWPRNHPNDECDNELMKKSLKELRQRWNKGQQLSDAQPTDHPVYGRFQPVRKTPPKKATVHFFLGSGKGLKKLVHVSKISSNIHQLERREFIWGSDEVHKYLLKVEGKLLPDNTVDYRCGSDTINIAVALPRKGTLQSREEVTFYIGFSWKGPMAYYVQLKGLLCPIQPISLRSECLPVIRRAQTRSAIKIPFMSVLDYQNERRKIVRKLSAITEIKAKLKRNEKLEKNQLAKLEKEHEIRQQLMELEANYQKQHDMDQED